MTKKSKKRSATVLEDCEQHGEPSHHHHEPSDEEAEGEGDSRHGAKRVRSQTKGGASSRGERSKGGAKAHEPAPPAMPDDDAEDSLGDIGMGNGGVPPQDPITSLIPHLQRIASVNEPTAKDILTEVLAANPALASSKALWLEEAQIRIACCHEIDDEAEVLRAAMASSLQDAEELKRKQQEEEAREGRVAAIRRKYADSALLSEFSRIICPSLLVTSPAHHHLIKLLDYERKCKKWYSGRGTYVFYERQAQALAAQLSTELLEAARACQLPAPAPACAPTPSTLAVPATGNPTSTQPLLNPLPQLCCISPSTACTLCGAPAAEIVNGMSQLPETASEEGPGAWFWSSYPQLSGCMSAFGQRLADKEAYIQVEVSKMPTDNSTHAISKTTPGTGSKRADGKVVSGGGSSILTHVPEIFKLPLGERAMDVVECFSDDD